jgi:hypothetical protein
VRDRNVSDSAATSALITGRNPTTVSPNSTSLLEQLRYWIKVARRLLTRWPQKDDQVDQTPASLKIRIDGSMRISFDGDAIGECTTLFGRAQRRFRTTGQ